MKKVIKMKQKGFFWHFKALSVIFLKKKICPEFPFKVKKVRHSNGRFKYHINFTEKVDFVWSI